MTEHKIISQQKMQTSNRTYFLVFKVKPEGKQYVEVTEEIKGEDGKVQRTTEVFFEEQFADFAADLQRRPDVKAKLDHLQRTKYKWEPY